MIPSLNQLAARFPALDRMGRAVRRMPHVHQVAAADCGASCLTAVLRFHGSAVPSETVRETLGVGRDGTSAQRLIEGAAAHGLRGRGIRVSDVRDLAYAMRGTILHWNLDHYVVLDRVDRSGIRVVDPAVGRRRIPWATVGTQFSGIAVELEPGEGFEAKARRRDPLWAFVRTALGEKGRWRRLLTISAVLQGLSLAGPLLIGLVVDRVVPLADVPLLGAVAVGATTVVAFQWLASLVRAHLLLHARITLDARLTLALVDRLVDLPFPFFQSRSQGDLLMRVNSASALRELLTSGLMSAVLDGGLVVVLAVALCWMSPAMAAVALAIAALQFMGLLAMWRRQHEWMAETLVREAASQSYQLELLRGMESLKAMGLERAALAHWSNLFVDVLNVHLRRGELTARFESATSAIRLASPLLMLWMGAWLVLHSDLSLGQMLAATALAAGLLRPLSTLVETGRQVQLFVSTYDRIRDVMQATPERDPGATPGCGPIAGEICVDQVQFRYSPSTAPVLQDVTLQVRPGELVAIVGRSGSGKSTLARLILGLLQPDAGRVRVDGHDLSTADLRAVRRHMGLVAQTPVVLGQTVRQNLQLAAPEASLPRLVQAMRRAAMHDDVVAMPMGYDTVLTNGGAALSGGQRQRLALARALVREPAILVLDEATSALDAVTEAVVHAQLEALDCTRIVVAHRLSTVARADRIVVLDGGRVVEVGRHEDLLAQEGAYAQLVASQVLPADAAAPLRTRAVAPAP